MTKGIYINELAISLNETGVNKETSMKVVVATHPSIADWTNPDTDPTKLIKKAINC